MSKIKSGTATVCYPPPFPSKGRLPTQPALIGENCRQQDSLELAYRQELCVAAGKRVATPCCKTLHISLFFDGTGNNLNHDVYVKGSRGEVQSPTNIARLFRATIGSGLAGGAPKEVTDTQDQTGNKYFKYYIPGVGTPFPEVEDNDFSTMGLVAATCGEERVNWGLLRIIDALMRTMGLGRLDDGTCLSSVKAMGTWMATMGLAGSVNRYSEFQRLLRGMAPKLYKAINQSSPGQPKLLGIKLYVYGFSRGAAEARAFVNWLAELITKPKDRGRRPEQCLQVHGIKIPISVEFLGLLDTVASVGIAHIAPVAEGHMGWADGVMELPNEADFSGLIKRCVHFVAAHEQRLCFPLDSVRRTQGQYPQNCIEVIYPGMHSDIGGGYPPGDQGKGNPGNTTNDDFLLSQIILHDLYAEAFNSGAPLKVPTLALPKELVNDVWRKMPAELALEFAIAPDLVQRFNAWRELTLGLPAPQTPISAKEALNYSPVAAGHSIEKAIENQIGWITAWRIDRYARKSMLKTPFYCDRATNTMSDKSVRAQKEKERNEAQKQVEGMRKDQQARRKRGDPFEPALPGVKDFDPDIAKTQLFEAAQEFGEDYAGKWRTLTSTTHLLADKSLQHIMFIINNDDERAERIRIKADGDARVKILFPDAGEASNAEQPSGWVRALFDDQVHDSRAWFMHAALGSREPFAGYFIDRMIYFGEACSKEWSVLLAVKAQPGIGAVEFIFNQFATPDGIATEVNAIDTATGLPVPVTIEKTRLPGEFVRQQKALVAEQFSDDPQQRLADIWQENQRETVQV